MGFQLGTGLESIFIDVCDDIPRRAGTAIGDSVIAGKDDIVLMPSLFSLLPCLRLIAGYRRMSHIDNLIPIVVKPQFPCKVIRLRPPKVKVEMAILLYGSLS